MKFFKKKIIEDIKMHVGKDKVICGLSGGVDSTVTAALINSAIGKNLICVFVVLFNLLIFNSEGLILFYFNL